MARKVIYIVAGLVIILLLAIVALPFLIDANRFRPQIEAAADSALNRKVEIGNIRLAILSGGVSVDDLSISDDPVFNSGVFLKAKSLAVSVELMPLIFSREIHVTGITIDQPEVTLLRSPSGMWNFSSLGAAGSQEKAASAPTSSANASPAAPPASVSVQRVTITNGTLSVGNTGANGKRHEYDQVNIEASNLSYTTQFPFTFTAKTPGNGSVKLTGKAGPLNQTDSAQTPVDASLDVQNLDLTSTGFLDPSSGMAGLVNFSGSLTSDGQLINSKGAISASKLQLVPGSSPAKVPLQIDYDAEFTRKQQTGVLKQGDVHVGKALSHLTGTYNTSGEIASIQMKLVGESMPASDLESVLPAIGVILPSGATITEGALNVNLAISGPVNRLVTTGPVNLSNAKLAGFDLSSRLGALASFAGLPKGSDTAIQTLSSDLRVAPEGIRSDNLNIVVPSIGSMTGNGTMASDQKLDFKMVARLSGTSGVLGGITKLAAGLNRQSGGGGGIPFKIQGTSSNPVFLPDMSGLTGGIAKSGATAIPSNAEDLGKALGGLFGKKKKP